MAKIRYHSKHEVSISCTELSRFPAEPTDSRRIDRATAQLLAKKKRKKKTYIPFPMSFDLTILKAYKNLLVFLAFVKITNVQLKVQGTSIWSHSFYEIRAGEVRKTFAVSNREASPGCSSILAFNRPYSGVDL